MASLCGMGLKKIITLCFIVFGVCGFSFADWSQVDPSQFSVEPPPEEGTDWYRMDFVQLHRAQNERTEADCRLAWKQLFPSFPAFYEVSQSPLDDAEAIATKEVLDKVIKSTIRVSSHFKGIFQRPRPYDVDETIKPCIKKPGGSTSYPSSHAAVASATACLLAQRFPQKSRTIEKYGSYLAKLRVLVGVHHPSDVSAGEALGKSVCEHLLSDPTFLKVWNPSR